MALPDLGEAKMRSRREVDRGWKTTVWHVQLLLLEIYGF